MARYIGPKAKIARKFNDPIIGGAKALKKKSYPPGQHGKLKVRRKKSEYGMQMLEKQKAKYTYGLLEKQFYNLFQKSTRKQGVTGEVLLQMLECRLDNIVYRLGIATTRRAARQLVNHGHIEVDGRRVSIPSYTLKPGSIISVKEKSKSLAVINESLDAFKTKFEWLEWDQNLMSGKLISIPERASIPEKINEQSIVELYSK